MPQGLKIPENSKTSLPVTNKTRSIISKVKRIVLKFGLDDETWAEAISSQYFLLCLAKQLKLEKHDYDNLINKCLEPFRFTYDFELKMDDRKLLITPEETKRIIESMQEEDKKDNYYKQTQRMQAKNIDPQLMYQNFHFGLLIRNVSTKESEILKRIRLLCLNKLTDDQSVDNSGGWYPYRVPWITGRILVSLYAVDFSNYSKINELKGIIDEAIESLYRRISENGAYWRSGVGEWVSKWESTGICLEALFLWDTIKDHTKEIEEIIKYSCDENRRQEWLNCVVDFSKPEKANAVLSAVTLASVLYRVTEEYFSETFSVIRDEIVSFFGKVVNTIDRTGVNAVQQYCTLPQILYYVVAAFESTIKEAVK